MPEHVAWQVTQMYPNSKGDLDDLGLWEPFAVGPEGQIYLKRQTTIEGDKSSVGHELSFHERHDIPYQEPKR